MEWYINRGTGQAEGPFDDATVIQAIAAGTVTAETPICQAGSNEWKTASEHAPFAAVLPGKRRAARRQIPWATISAASTLVACALVGVVIWRQVVGEQAARVWRGEQATRLDGITAELKIQNVEAKWLDASDVHHNCYTDNTDVTCYFTNLAETPITTCTARRQLHAPLVLPHV